MERALKSDSQTISEPSPRVILESQLRECYGRVVYSHKVHEKCADIALSQLSIIKHLQIFLSALTTGGFIAAVFVGKIASIVGVIISTSLLILNAYMKNYDFGKIAQKHRQAGADLWLIREKYFSLLTDIRVGEEPLEKLQIRRDELLEQLHAVYSGAPSTTNKAYKKAQKALKQLEDMTFSDDEIDAFLPKELRKS
jgi:hypothetical protein